MNFLFEGPLLIGIIGLVLVIASGFFYMQTRSRGSFVALIALIGLTVALMVVERLWITPREAVTSSVVELFNAIQEEDLTWLADPD